MRPAQRLIASDGYEVALFPMEYMYITQGEMMPDTSWSHYNTYNMDFWGYGEYGQFDNCPLYAPVSCHVVALWDYTGTHTVTFQSDNLVHFADGSLDIMTFEFTHAVSPPYHTIGDSIGQGELIYYTGTYGKGQAGTYGDHVHICCGKGAYDGYTQRVGGHYDLTNRWHLYDSLYINDTIIAYDGHSYPWKTWDGPVPPTPTPTPRPKSHFPWVLYAKKLRKNV